MSDVGGTYVTIRPDLDGFEEELKAELDEQTAGLDQSVRITADGDDAMAVIAEIKAEEDTLDDKSVVIRVEDDGTLAAAGAGLEGLTADMESAGTESDGLSAKFVSHIETIQALSGAATDAGMTYNDFDSALQRAGITFDDVSEMADGLGISTNDLAAGLANVASSGARLAPFWEELDRGALDISAYLPSVVSGAADVQAGLDQLATVVETGADGLTSYKLDAEGVVAGLEGMGLVSRNAGGDLLDMQGNLTTTNAVLKDFGVTLDSGLVSTVGLDQALSNFAKGGLLDAEHGTQDLSSMLASSAVAGFDAADDAAFAYQAGMQAAAEGSLLAETGIREMDDALVDAASIFDDAGLASQATLTDFLAVSNAALDLSDTMAALGESSGGSGAGGGLEDAASGAEGFGFELPSLIAMVVAFSPELVALAGAAVGVAGALVGAAAVGTGLLLPFIAAAAGDLGALHPEITQIEDDWKGWSASFQPIVTSSLVPWLDDVNPALQSLSPLVSAAGSEIRDLGDDVGSAVNSPGWTQMIDWIDKEGPPSIDAFAKGIGNIGEAIVNMGETGSPAITMVDDGWKSLTQDLASFGQSSTFKDFVSWLQTNLPTIGRDLEEIGTDAGHLLSALGEIGTPLLSMFTDVVNDARNVTGDVVGWSEDIGHALDDVFGSGASGLEKMAVQEETQVTNLANILDGTKQVSAAQESAARSGMSLVELAEAQAQANATEAKNAADGITAVGTALSGFASTIKNDLDSWNSSTAADEVTIKTLRDTVSDLGSSTQSSFAGATSIVSAFSGQVKVTGADISNFYATSVLGAQQFTSDIQKAIQDGYNPQLIAQLLEAGPAQAGPILQGLVSSASGSFVQMVNSSASALNSIGQTEIEEAKLTQTAIDTNSAKTTADYSTAMALLAQISADGGKTTVEQLSAQLGMGQDQISQILSEYSDVFEGGMANIEGEGTTGGATTGKNVASGLASATAAVGNGATQIANVVDTVFAGLYGSSEHYGETIGDGITAGMASKAGEVMAEAGTLVSNALGAIDAALGHVNSPAPATIPFGEAITEGLQSGMNSASGGLTDTATQVTASATQATQLAVFYYLTALHAAEQNYLTELNQDVTSATLSMYQAAALGQTAAQDMFAQVVTSELGTGVPAASAPGASPVAAPAPSTDGSTLTPEQTQLAEFYYLTALNAAKTGSGTSTTSAQGGTVTATPDSATQDAINAATSTELQAYFLGQSPAALVMAQVVDSLKTNGLPPTSATPATTTAPSTATVPAASPTALTYSPNVVVNVAQPGASLEQIEEAINNALTTQFEAAHAQLTSLGTS